MRDLTAGDVCSHSGRSVGGGRGSKREDGNTRVGRGGGSLSEEVPSPESEGL